MRVRCWLLVIALCGLGASARAQEVIEVLLFAEDGAVMMGYWYVAESDPPAPAVLLLHMLNGQAQDWQSLPGELAQAGIHALALDLRGHGESGGARDWALAQRDLTKWWHWLAAHAEVDANAMAVIGASIGANLALLRCAEWADCRGAFALSPGLDYRGVQPQSALAEATAPPATLIAARGDTYSAESVLRFAVESEGEIRLWLLPGRAHGTRMFATDDGERIRSALLAELELLFAGEG